MLFQIRKTLSGVFLRNSVEWHKSFRFELLDLMYQVKKAMAMVI